MRRHSYLLLILCLGIAQGLFAQAPLPPPPIEAPPDSDKFMSEFMNMLSTLAIIIVFIFIATWFLKRMLNVKVQQMNTTSLIKITERRSLSPKTVLYLLEIRDKEIAVAETAQGLTLLGEFALPAQPELKTSKNFQEILEQTKHENKP